MELTKVEANKLLENLFSNVRPFTKESKPILLKVENCTLYIPVQNLDESQVPEFIEQFTIVYNVANDKPV